MNSLYQVRMSDITAVHPLKWIGPEDIFPSWDWVTVAEAKSDDDSDGQSVTIQECAGPARFFRAIVHAGVNSVGEPLAGYEITTGSGSSTGHILCEMAAQIAGGMLVFRPTSQVTPAGVMPQAENNPFSKPDGSYDPIAETEAALRGVHPYQVDSDGTPIWRDCRQCGNPMKTGACTVCGTAE